MSLSVGGCLSPTKPWAASPAPCAPTICWGRSSPLSASVNRPLTAPAAGGAPSEPEGVPNEPVGRWLPVAHEALGSITGAVRPDEFVGGDSSPLSVSANRPLTAPAAGGAPSEPEGVPNEPVGRWLPGVGGRMPGPRAAREALGGMSMPCAPTTCRESLLAAFCIGGGRTARPLLALRQGRRSLA